MLRTLFVDDFAPWEKEYLLPFAHKMTQELEGRLEVVDWGSTNRRLESPVVWILARNWRKALTRLRVTPKSGRVFVSVINQSVGNDSAFLAFWRRYFAALPKRVTLISHNPLTHRFLREMEGVDAQQLVDLPLPYPDFVQFGTRSEVPSQIVGTLTPLDGNANLNFLILVAHRLLHKNPLLRFRVLGDGPLRGHLTKMATLLQLGGRFDVSPVARLADIVQWDAFIFAPLRCDHLIAPLSGIAARVPTVCAETPGMGEWLSGLAVPFTPLFDTEAMAKGVEELLTSAPARSHNRLMLGEGLASRLATSRVATLYEKEMGIQALVLRDRAVA
ncbi:MAG: glycosyltransferase family 4 protein [Deltaproteobacteria bacterium]|nr:glycosyltransferase family 4 protein [Deltaproteobacteria bacterium]MBI3295187.1 glycosyltransferase family 4 protein [Deltaproteobacteria bacterium]